MISLALRYQEPAVPVRWSDFEWASDPGVVDGMLAMLVLWLVIAIFVRKQVCPEEPFPKKELLWFLGGLGVLVVAVLSPIDAIGEQYLFWVHMIQHSILIYIFPIFFIWGIPKFFYDYLNQFEFFRSWVYFLSQPLIATLIFSALFYGWHVPALYDWALRDRFVHLVEHASFVAGAVIFWWPLIGQGRRVLHPGLKLLYILGNGILQTPAFAILTFSKTVLYPTYAQAPRIMNLSALHDQQAGGIIMKISMILAMVGLLVGVWMEWYASEQD